jgi:nucleoid-associated protein YgaU
MSGDRAWTRPLGLAVAGALATWALWKMGSRLPMPRSLEMVEVETWLREAGGPAAAFAIVRVGALAVAAYATLLGALGTVALATRAAALSRIVLRLALPTLRPLLAPAAAITITIASALPAAAQGRGEPSRPAPVMQMIGPAASEPPVMTFVITPPPAAETPQAAPATYTVAPGDTFWSIADQTLRAAGHDPDDGAIIPYWRSLIEANRDRLRARDEPDLIFPGQVFVLPPLS